jgi:hypothetical protein
MMNSMADNKSEGDPVSVIMRKKRLTEFQKGIVIIA